MMKNYENFKEDPTLHTTHSHSPHPHRSPVRSGPYLKCWHLFILLHYTTTYLVY